jgi:CysZ protein
MFKPLFLAISDFRDPGLRRVLWLSLAVSLAMAGLAVALAWAALGAIDLVSIPWLETAIDILGAAAVLVIAWLLFPVLLPAVVALFLDRAAAIVERRHEPGLPPATGQRFVDSLSTALRFGLVAILLNLAVLPLLLIPGLNLFLFFGLNGYLLGREYFELVAGRRLKPAEIRSFRRNHRVRLFGLGAVMAGLSLAPLLGLFVPVFAAVSFLHLSRFLPKERESV